jgi:hypothetical protein
MEWEDHKARYWKATMKNVANVSCNLILLPWHSHYSELTTCQLPWRLRVSLLLQSTGLMTTVYKTKFSQHWRSVVSPMCSKHNLHRIFFLLVRQDQFYLIWWMRPNPWGTSRGLVPWIQNHCSGLAFIEHLLCTVLKSCHPVSNSVSGMPSRGCFLF